MFIGRGRQIAPVTGRLASWMPVRAMLVVSMLAAAPVAVPRPAAAQMAIATYGEILEIAGRGDRDAALAEKASKALAQFHAGMDAAIGLANAAFVQAGAQPSFCLPAGMETGLQLRPKVAKEMLERKEEWAVQSRASVGLVAIAVLRAEYPCR